MNSVLTIIPARGGSKGVKGKNMRILGNKPLLEYSIEKAKYIKDKYGVKWCVSSDCPITYVYSIKRGGEKVELRNSYYSQDHISSAQSIINHLDSFDIMRQYKWIIILQPTTPYTRKDTIDRAFNLLQQNLQREDTSIISMKKVPHTLHAEWQFEEVNKKENLVKQYGDTRKVAHQRQELKEAYYRDGAIYVVPRAILEEDAVVADRVLCVDTSIIDDDKHVNIDTELDFEAAKRYVRDFNFYE